jgi:hypothetical protein
MTLSAPTKPASGNGWFKDNIERVVLVRFMYVIEHNANLMQG